MNLEKVEFGKNCKKQPVFFIKHRKNNKFSESSDLLLYKEAR